MHFQLSAAAFLGAVLAVAPAVNAAAVTASPASITTSGHTWKNLGCFKKTPTFNNVLISSVLPISNEKCLDLCTASGYPFAALEYSVECPSSLPFFFSLSFFTFMFGFDWEQADA